jgi:hypothetical protein
VAPPRGDPDTDHTLVVVAPDPQLVQYSPKYLQALVPWVERGGRLVVAPSAADPERNCAGGTCSAPDDAQSPHDVLTLLGLSDQLALDQGPAVHIHIGRNHVGSESLTEQLWDAWRGRPVQTRTLAVKCSGGLSALGRSVHQLATPWDRLATLSAKSEPVGGAVSYVDVRGKEHLLVAAIRRGKGEIIVCSEPRLVSNELVARADNSVLAAELLAPQGRPVVVDEFYHGLLVRGNPLYLLTRPALAAVAVGLLLVVGAWTWRSAMFLGPPLEDRPPSRRDIREYIHAMGQFFCRGAGHRRFLAREIRDGVLRQLCDELKLPLETPEAGAIVARLGRRHPERALRLQAALRQVDARLAAGGEYPRTSFLPDMQRLAGCL